MPSSSRIIGAERLTDVRRFPLGELGGVPARPPADPYADDPAFQAGRELGLREGIRQGIEMARQQAAREQAKRQADAAGAVAARAASLAEALEEQFAAIGQSVADELVDLALELARQTVRQALRVERDAIVAVVQEAVAALIDERASFAVHLNPADVELVREALGDVLAARSGRLVPDARVAAGGCRVLSAGAEVDATVATRWRRVLASVGREVPEDDPLTHG
jgi:flagellar assembly protein FliH